MEPYNSVYSAFSTHLIYYDSPPHAFLTSSASQVFNCRQSPNFNARNLKRQVSPTPTIYERWPRSKPLGPGNVTEKN